MVEVKFCHKFSQNVSWRKLDQPYALLCMLCNYDNPVTECMRIRRCVRRWCGAHYITVVSVY